MSYLPPPDDGDGLTVRVVVGLTWDADDSPQPVYAAVTFPPGTVATNTGE